MDQISNRQHRAVLYIRVASAQDDLGAIDHQREGCRRIAAEHGLTIVREYVDAARPARLPHQIELQRLLDELHQRRDAAFVVVWDYARLARDLTSLDDILRRIHACDAEVATMTGVQTAERFTAGGLLDRVAEWANRPEQDSPYPLSLLRAAHRGLGPNQSLMVTATLPHGETIHGHVIGIGSLLGIGTDGGRLVEDVRAEWVSAADVHERRQP